MGLTNWNTNQHSSKHNIASKHIQLSSQCKRRNLPSDGSHYLSFCFLWQLLSSLTTKRWNLYPIFSSDVKIDDATHAPRRFEKICYYSIGLPRESRIVSSRSKHGSQKWGGETGFEIFKEVRSEASMRVPQWKQGLERFELSTCIKRGNT